MCIRDRIDITAETMSSESGMTDEASNVGSIVGGVFAALIAVASAVVVAVILVILLIRRKRRAYRPHFEKKELPPMSMIYINSEEDQAPQYEEVKSAVRPSPPKRPAGVAPVIQNFPSTMTVEEGHGVTFNVQVSGTPKPICTWYHEGNSIQSDYAHEIHEDGSLVILTAEIQHQGIYQFVAINSSGRVDRKVVLNVVQEGTDEARKINGDMKHVKTGPIPCLLYTSPSPRDRTRSRMPSSA